MKQLPFFYFRNNENVNTLLLIIIHETVNVPLGAFVHITKV